MFLYTLNVSLTIFLLFHQHFNHIIDSLSLCFWLNCSHFKQSHVFINQISQFVIDFFYAPSQLLVQSIDLLWRELKHLIFCMGKLSFHVIHVLWIDLDAIVFHYWLRWLFCEALMWVRRLFYVGWTFRFLDLVLYYRIVRFWVGFYIIFLLFAWGLSQFLLFYLIFIGVFIRLCAFVINLRTELLTGITNFIYNFGMIIG